MASIDSLTDGEIRSELTRFGYPVGPITATTRKVLLKKLKQLLDQSNSGVNDSRLNRSSSRFSSGDESEDNAKPETSRKTMPPPKKTTPVRSSKRRSSGRTTNSSLQENETASNVSIFTSASEHDFATSSPDKDKFLSPSSFDSNLKGKGTSLFGRPSISSRRSFRSEIENNKNAFNSFDTGSDTDADDHSTRTKSSNFFVNDKYGSEGFSRTLGMSSPLSTSYLPAESFKNRLSNSKPADDAKTNLSKDNYENSFSDRRFTRTSLPSTSFSSRMSSTQITSPTLGLSNVKESDDEEPLRSSVPASPYNNRWKTDRWTLNKPWWTNTSIVSMSLIILLVSFFVLIFVSYINVKWKDSNIATSDINFPICKGNHASPGVNCIVQDDVRAVMEVFREIFKKLHDHVVKVKCDDSSKNSGLSWEQLHQLIIQYKADMSVWHLEQQTGNVKVLINANPSFGVLLTDDRLDISEPSLPFSCLIMHNVFTFFWFLVRLLVAGIVLYVVKKGFNLWMGRKEGQKKEVFKLVEAIVDLLQTHSQNSGDRDSFLAVDHVRDQIIPLQHRYSMAKLWEEAVACIESQESRIRSEIQPVAGENCRVWRWLPSNSRRKMWQGQAFPTQEGSVNSLTYSPTPCLKIRHMFDPEVEVGDEWMTLVKNAILEKCEGIDVLHIAVDRGSQEGCVYLKCSSPEEAGRAYRALHGSWFDTKLVTVKYLRLNRYHERFPDALRSTLPLRPSNNHKMSLQ